MDYQNKIISDPSIMLGKPIIKGTRITVELIIKKLSDGFSIDDILKGYPHLEREDVLAALAYSSDVISKEEIIVS